jgi:hypothetical protein
MRFHHMCVVTTDIDRAVRCGSSGTPTGFDVAVRMSIPDGDDFGPDILAPRKLRNHQGASAFTTNLKTNAERSSANPSMRCSCHSGWEWSKGSETI